MRKRKKVSGIPLFLLVCIYTMHLCSMEHQQKDDKVNINIKVFSPWIERMEDASDYMSEAISSNAIKRVEEKIKGRNVITTFDPQTKNIAITIDDSIRETIEFNLFMRYLHVLHEVKKNQISYKAKECIKKCTLF